MLRWTSNGLIFLALGALVIWGVSRRAAEPGSARGARPQLAAILRQAIALLLAALVASWLAGWAGHLAEPARWAVWVVLGLALLAVGVNGIAGAWFLLPQLGRELGGEVSVIGRRGVVTAYGWTGLHITTAAGWRLHVPYLSVAFRSFGARTRGGRHLASLTLRAEHWADEDIRRLRQIAVLSPYRDPGLPVDATRRGHSLEIRLGLIDRRAEARVLAQLEHAAARGSRRSDAPRPIDSRGPRSRRS